MHWRSAAALCRHDSGRVVGLVAAAALAVSVPVVLPHVLLTHAVAPAVAADSPSSTHPGGRWSVGRTTVAEVAAQTAERARDARALAAKAADRARQTRASARRTARLAARAPLAARAQWAAAAAHRQARPVEKPPPMTDLQRAENLPEPWRSIVRCESVRDRSWQLASSSRARGWFQFLRSTWRSLGLSGDPAAAPFDVQYAAARELARRDGLRAWSCARILGLA